MAHRTPRAMGSNRNWLRRRTSGDPNTMKTPAKYQTAALLTLFATSPIYPQSGTETAEQARARLSSEIRRAQQSLAKELPVSPSSYQKDRDTADQEIERMIVDYMEKGEAGAPDDAGTLRADLNNLLEYGNPYGSDEGFNTAPFVEAAEISGHHFEIMQYTLMGAGRGAPDTQTAIAAYLSEDGHLRLQSAFTPDFDGYAVTTKPIQSPIPGQLYYLVYGPKYGFNGTLVRIRVFAFDGLRWRVLWAPGDTLNAEVEAIGDKILVTHLDTHQYYELRKPPFNRHETYRITPEGVQHSSSELGPE